MIPTPIDGPTSPRPESRTTISPRAMVVGTLAVIAATAITAAGQPTILDLGVLPGGSVSYGLAVSADGSAVAGECSVPGAGGGGLRAIRWTSAEGMQDLGVVVSEGPAITAYAGMGISGDGAVVVGNALVPGVGYQAFRWTSAGGPQFLAGLLLGLNPNPIFGSNVGYAVSADGTAATGWSHGNSGTCGVIRAVRWNAAGIVNLGVFPGDDPCNAALQGFAISADGSAIAGYSYAAPNVRAFLWTEGAGLQNLGLLPGGGASRASAISADGSVVVGSASTAEGRVRAFRWTAVGGMQELGALCGLSFTDSYGVGVSGDGRVAGGSRTFLCSSSADSAWLWSAGLGMRDLRTYLTSLGVDTSAWRSLQVVSSLSADGSTITGTGVLNDPSRSTRAFLISGLPVCPAICPADTNCSGTLSVQDIFDFLAFYFASDLRADFNASGTLSVQDIFDFLAAYFAGCG